MVAAGSTTTRLGNLGTWYLPFLKALAYRKWPVDVFVGHFYPPANGTPVTRQAQILQFRSYLAQAHAPSKPIWDGEVNYGAPGLHLAYRRWTTPWVRRTWRVPTWTACASGLRASTGARGCPRRNVYGVTMWPGYSYGPRALRTTYGWLANKWWRGCGTSKLSTGTFVTCLVSSTTSASSFTARIVWSEGKTVSYKVPSGVTRLCTATGACAATKAGRVLKIGQSPVWLGR